MIFDREGDKLDDLVSAGSLVHLTWVPPIVLHLVLVVTGLLGLGSSLLSAGPGCCHRCRQGQEPQVPESALQEGESQDNRYSRFP